jgi:hypothetical protein
MRVNVIGVKHFRDAMDDDWMGKPYELFNRKSWRTESLAKLEYYEFEYQKLKEITSLLELALWKARIDDASVDQGKVMGSGNKKMKMVSSDFRLQCRVSCGADHVLENVFPYLLPPNYVRAYEEDEWRGL